MSRQEAYRIVYKFMMEHGILQLYCNNVIMSYKLDGIDLHGKSSKEILKVIIDKYLEEHPSGTSKCLVFVWMSGSSSFMWFASHEGEDFWSQMYGKWVKMINKNNLTYALIEA